MELGVCMMDADGGDTNRGIPSQGYGRSSFTVQSMIIWCSSNENAMFLRQLRWEQQELLMNLRPRFPYKRQTRPLRISRIPKCYAEKKKLKHSKQPLNASRTIRRLMCKVPSQQISKWVTSRKRETSQISPQCVKQGSGCRTDSQELLDGDQNNLEGGNYTFWRGFEKSLSCIISWMMTKSEWCLTYVSPDTNSKAAAPLDRFIWNDSKKYSWLE